MGAGGIPLYLSLNFCCEHKTALKSLKKKVHPTSLRNPWQPPLPATFSLPHFHVLFQSIMNIRCYGLSCVPPKFIC